MFKELIKTKKAFSLIEIITVLFIISLALVGVLSLIVQNIKSQNINKESLIAYQLAQEGIELIRGVRDSNWKSGNAWDTGLAEDTYYMDYSQTAPVSTVNAEPLYLNSDDFYVHDDASGSNILTDFSRIISVVHIDNHTLDIVSTVFWHSHNGEHEYKIEALLYDWY